MVGVELAVLDQVVGRGNHWWWWDNVDMSGIANQGSRVNKTFETSHQLVNPSL